MRGAAPTTCSKSASPRRARITSSPSTTARSWRPGSPAPFQPPGRSPDVLQVTEKPLDIQVTATDSGLDVDVRGSGKLTPERMAALARVAQAHKLARLTRHGEMVAQNAQPLITVGRAQVPLPPGAFLQATALGEATLARLVTGYVGKAKRVADLFAGIGTFALRLAESARVTRRRQRGGCHRRLEQGGRRRQRAEADRSRDARPVPPAADGERTESLRRRGVRSAAPGRRAAGAGTGARAACAPSWRCRATPTPSRAMCGFWSTAAIG